MSTGNKEKVICEQSLLKPDKLFSLYSAVLSLDSRLGKFIKIPKGCKFRRKVLKNFEIINSCMPILKRKSEKFYLVIMNLHIYNL